MNNNYLKKETLTYLNEIQSIAYRCVIDEHFFEIVTRNTKNDFWNVVQNALGDGVCIYWSHLFGNNNDHFHYSKFFNRPDVQAAGEEYSTEAIKKRILAVIEYNDTQYDQFWNEVKCCRDKFLAHKDKDAKCVYPTTHICRLMAEELRVILYELVEKWLVEFRDDDHLVQELSFLKIGLKQSNSFLHEKCLNMYNSRGLSSFDAT